MNFLVLLKGFVCPDNSSIIAENNSLKSRLADSVNKNNFLISQLDSADSTITNLQTQNSSYIRSIVDLKDSLNVSEPASTGIIKLSEVFILLSKVGIVNISLSDEYFNLCSVDDAKKYSSASKVQYRSWVAEDHDCDNFSFALLGYWSNGLKSFAFGYARSATHAFNVFIDDNKELWVVEPQTNKYFKYSENKDVLYKITEVLI